MTTTIRVRCPKCSAQFDTSTRSDQALCQICGTLSERVACERAAKPKQTIDGVEVVAGDRFGWIDPNGKQNGTYQKKDKP